MCPNLNQHIYCSFYNTRQTLFVIIDAILWLQRQWKFLPRHPFLVRAITFYLQYHVEWSFVLDINTIILMHLPNVPMVLPSIAARLFAFSLGFALFYRCLCVRQLVIAKYYDVIFCFSFIGPEIAVYRESLWHLPMSHRSNHRRLTFALNMQSSF